MWSLPQEIPGIKALTPFCGMRGLQYQPCSLGLLLLQVGWRWSSLPPLPPPSAQCYFCWVPRPHPWLSAQLCVDASTDTRAVRKASSLEWL